MADIDALVARARRGILKAKAFDLGPSGAVTMSEFEALLDALEAERSKRVRLEEALKRCQGVLSVLTNPNDKTTLPSIQVAWAQCVEAETVARSALSHSSSKGESRE